VTLVDLQRGVIEAITEAGIQTAQGHYEIDVIVFATGFDAMTGAIHHIDLTVTRTDSCGTADWKTLQVLLGNPER
jgi:cation diffusion facilitator CzcD-associated flavoprotein CzcO